jgi:hypothetical protein
MIRVGASLEVSMSSLPTRLLALGLLAACSQPSSDDSIRSRVAALAECQHLVDHACTLAQGTVTRTVTAGIRTGASQPAIIPRVHHTVRFPTGSVEGVVRFSGPAGQWAILTNPSVGLIILDQQGTEVAKLFDDTTSCGELPRLRVFALASSQSYRLVLERPATGDIEMVIEFVTDYNETWYRDEDGDGFGGSSITSSSCSSPAGYVEQGGDCADTNAAIHPGVTDVCDGVDNDCDANLDEDPDRAFYADLDADGHGAGEAVYVCTQPEGRVASNDDCDDTHGDSYPGTTEVCDLRDNDCDGETDEGVRLTFYRDTDGDGHGDVAVTTQACTVPDGFAAASDDCDDARSDVYPLAAETCDLADNDCDGVTDEDGTAVFYADADGDTYGDGATTSVGCYAPEGYTGRAGDCDDTRADSNPEAAEICDGADNDCDGATDEDNRATYYRDADGDTFGNAGDSQEHCAQPEGYVPLAGDCNDARADVYTGAPEACDDTDNDCDGLVDEDGTSVFFRDSDGDGFGDLAVTSVACRQNPGWVPGAGDCNDFDAAVSPSAEEICDGIDNDCDGNVDFVGETYLCQCESTTIVSEIRYRPLRWRDGSATFEPSMLFEVPATLPVSAGNAGNLPAVLWYIDADGRFGFCEYQGGASRAFPTSSSDIAKGKSYKLKNNWFCGPGKRIDAAWVQLTIIGSPLFGTTRASATLEPLTCDGN